MNKTSGEVIQYLDCFFEKYVKSDSVDVVIFPQFPCLYSASNIIPKDWVFLWAQNMNNNINWAFTWEVSPLILTESKCNYVLLWHSERRIYFWETDDLINKKIITAIENGIRPILCVWETLHDREMGNAESIVLWQLKSCLESINAKDVDVAYEPVWAIWTGKVATNEDILNMHDFIKKYLNNSESRVIYGGSSNDQNARDLIKISNVDWFLVWWASLDSNKFINMINAIK